MANATRLLPVLRRKVQASPTKSVRTLVETVSQALAPSNATRKLLLTQLETLAATLPAEKADAEAGKEDDPMDAEEPADKKAKEKRSMLPETEMYVGLVVLMFLIDSKATEAALDRIRRFDGAVNAWVLVDEDSARADAKASEARWMAGRPIGPVDGVPSSIKDLTFTRGWPTRKGSKTIAADGPWEVDAPFTAFMRGAGAVLLGKTTTPEFGWKGVTDSALTGITRNPWNVNTTAGGSSGGAGAAAALNMGVLHQGSDAGGSIRIPAAFTGVFGFKPTYGWTPQWPPATEPSLSHIGPLTRSVDDAVRMLNVIGRYDYRDPYATRGQPKDWGADLGKDLRGLRIAFSPTLGYVNVREDVAREVRKAVDVLAALGAIVEEVSAVWNITPTSTGSGRLFTLDPNGTQCRLELGPSPYAGTEISVAARVRYRGVEAIGTSANVGVSP